MSFTSVTGIIYAIITQVNVYLSCFKIHNLKIFKRKAIHTEFEYKLDPLPSVCNFCCRLPFHENGGNITAVIPHSIATRAYCHLLRSFYLCFTASDFPLVDRAYCHVETQWELCRIISHMLVHIKGEAWMPLSVILQ